MHWRAAQVSSGKGECPPRNDILRIAIMYFFAQ